MPPSAGDYAQQALHLIEKDFVTIRSENEKMLKERDSILPLALGRQLAHLVAAPGGEQAVAYAQSCLILAGIQSGERYAMFAVSCAEDGSGFFRTMSSDPRLQSQEGLFHYLLNNVLADLLFKDHTGTVASFHENWFLVLVACGSAVEAEQIESVIPDLQDFYSRAFSAVLVSTDIVQGLPLRFHRIGADPVPGYLLSGLLGQHPGRAGGNDGSFLHQLFLLLPVDP